MESSAQLPTPEVCRRLAAELALGRLRLKALGDRAAVAVLFGLALRAASHEHLTMQSALALGVSAHVLGQAQERPARVGLVRGDDNAQQPQNLLLAHTLLGPGGGLVERVDDESHVLLRTRHGI